MAVELANKCLKMFVFISLAFLTGRGWSEIFVVLFTIQFDDFTIGIYVKISLLER